MSITNKTNLMGDFLFGYIPGEERVCITNTAEQIAAFIMANQSKGQVKVVNFLDILEVQTMGPFIDYCENKHFLKNELLPVLVPMQQGEVEVPAFIPYVDNNYLLENVRGINEDGKYVLVNVDFFDYPEQTLVNEEIFETEEELIAKYPNSVSDEFAGWYINTALYDLNEFIEEYIDSECTNDNAQKLLAISDSEVEAFMAEEGYEDFKAAVTKKMNAMSSDELNQFAFEHGIWNRVKQQPVSKSERGNRYEFINAFIGWLGTEKAYKEVLKVSNEEYQRLICQDDEEFEDKICNALASFTIEQLNQFSVKHNYNFIVIQ